MSASYRVVIIGAGPAGIRAAQTLVSAGINPTMIDENSSWGGQIYRQPPANNGFIRSKAQLYGFEAKKASALHDAMVKLASKIDYRPNTLVWACGPNQLDTLHAGRESSVSFTHLIIASGATDRVIPVPGWTLAGVYTLGGSQVALKSQGCSIGRQVVLAGTGPLLYLVAYQYVKAGAQVVAVLDTSPFVRQLTAMPRMLSLPTTLAKGLYYVGWLQAHGVRIERGVTLLGFSGTTAVEGVRWRARRGGEQSVDCDAVGIGFGLRPETQLADLAGCQFQFDSLNRCWLPERDAAGRTSVPNVFVAGDGASIAGADAAELAGRRAALGLLADVGVTSTLDGLPTADTLEHDLRRISTFRKGIESAFAPPTDVAHEWPDDMIVCRCEEVRAGTMRACVRNGLATEINRLKALTRVGMGRCQGRMCGESATALLAVEVGVPLAHVGRLRSQAPIKPISITPLLYDETIPTQPEEARDE